MKLNKLKRSVKTVTFAAFFSSYSLLTLILIFDMHHNMRQEI